MGNGVKSLFLRPTVQLAPSAFLASATAATSFSSLFFIAPPLLYLLLTLLCPIGPHASLLSCPVEMMLVFREHGILHILTLL